MPNYKVEFDDPDCKSEDEVFEKYPESLLRKIETAVLNVNKTLPDKPLPLLVSLDGSNTFLSTKSDQLFIDPEFANDIPAKDLDYLLFHEACHARYRDDKIQTGLSAIQIMNPTAYTSNLGNMKAFAKLVQDQFGGVEQFNADTKKVSAILNKYCGKFDDKLFDIDTTSRQLAVKLIEMPAFQTKLNAFDAEKNENDFTFIFEYGQKMMLVNVYAILKDDDALAFDEKALQDANELFAKQILPYQDKISKTGEFLKSLTFAMEYRADFLAAKTIGVGSYANAFNKAVDWANRELTTAERTSAIKNDTGDAEHASTAERMSFIKYLVSRHSANSAPTAGSMPITKPVDRTAPVFAN